MTRRIDRLGCACAALLTTAAGAAIRFARLGLPGFLTKYGGSALWAAAIFWMLSTLWPQGRLAWRGWLAMAVAASIECFKLVQSPALDHLRATLFGKLVLGKYFAWADLVAYAVGIGAMVIVNQALANSVDAE